MIDVGENDFGGSKVESSVNKILKKIENKSMTGKKKSGDVLLVKKNKIVKKKYFEHRLFCYLLFLFGNKSLKNWQVLKRKNLKHKKVKAKFTSELTSAKKRFENKNKPQKRRPNTDEMIKSGGIRERMSARG